MNEIRWTDKVYLDSQGNIRSSDGCPNLINKIKVTYQYHLSCPQCGETWWDNDAFPIRCHECGADMRGKNNGN